MPLCSNIQRRAKQIPLLTKYCLFNTHCYSNNEIDANCTKNASLPLQTEAQIVHQYFPGGSDGKASACRAGDPGFYPWVGKIPWRRKWQLTPVLLPGKFHGLRSLVGYSPWGRKESDTTEQIHFTSVI